MGNHRVFAASSEADLVDEFVDIYCPSPYDEPNPVAEAETNEILLAEVENLEAENRFLEAKLATVMDQVAAMRAIQLQGGAA